MVYVTGCTSRGVRALFDQSEHGYKVRHGVYVHGSTNQSAAMAYVTVCTSRGVRTLFDQSGHDIQLRVRPLNMCAPPPAPSRPLKNPARSVPILLLLFIESDSEGETSMIYMTRSKFQVTHHYKEHNKIQFGSLRDTTINGNPF